MPMTASPTRPTRKRPPVASISFSVSFCELSAFDELAPEITLYAVNAKYR